MKIANLCITRNISINSAALFSFGDDCSYVIDCYGTCTFYSPTNMVLLEFDY